MAGEKSGLALVLAAHCRSKEREDMIVLPEKGVGRALFTALDQLAEVSGHAELKSVGIVALGWSGAGSLVARLAGYRPSRFVAGIAYLPGQYVPLGMDTIDLPREALPNPQLIIANAGDNINGTERPYAYFKKYFDAGAKWTFAIQNELPHCCLQNAQNPILEWLHAVLGQEGRLAMDSFGYLKVEKTAVLDEWKSPTVKVVSGRVGHRGKANKGELQSGWMPSTAFAEEWLTLVRKVRPISVWRP